MLLRGSIESHNHYGAIESVNKRSNKKLRRFFLFLYGFMLLSGSIESGNHNGVSKSFTSVRIRSYEEIFILVWLHVPKL